MLPMWLFQKLKWLFVVTGVALADRRTAPLSSDTARTWPCLGWRAGSPAGAFVYVVVPAVTAEGTDRRTAHDGTHLADVVHSMRGPVVQP